MNFGLPDPTQQLLLHAALDEGPSAITAFDAWKRYVDLNGPVETGCFRMLPLVHENLRRLNCDDPLMGRLGGIYRYHWCDTLRAMRGAGRPLRLIAEAGIPMLLSKGLALAEPYYGSHALRPMSDVDVMVPIDRVGDTVALLLDHGWSNVRPPRAGARLNNILAAQHAMSFADAEGIELDLHWRPLAEMGSTRARDAMWAAAVPMQIDGLAVKRFSSEHLILQAALHGLRPNPVAPIRWAADIMTIVRRDEPVDWGGLIAFARHEKVLSRLATAILYLVREFAMPVEDRIVRLLESYRPGAVERIETRLLSIPAQDEALFGPQKAVGIMRMVIDGRALSIPSVIAGAIRTRIPARALAQ